MLAVLAVDTERSLLGLLVTGNPLPEPGSLGALQGK